MIIILEYEAATNQRWLLYEPWLLTGQIQYADRGYCTITGKN